MSLFPNSSTPKFEDVGSLIKANGAFLNPLRDVIDRGTAQVATLLVDLPKLADPLDPSYSATVASDYTAILAAANGLATTLNRFGIHTDNLSGVSLSSGLNGANFATISTVMATVQKYQKDGSLCELVYKAFGAIMQAATYANAINAFIGRLITLYQNGPLLKEQLQNLKDIIEYQIEQDLLAFANAQIEALQYAAAAAITSLTGNPCIAEVLSRVGSQELKKVAVIKTREIIDF